MMQENRLYLIALTLLKGVGDVLARHLFQYFGSAEDVFKAKASLLEKVPGIGTYTAGHIKNAMPEALERAEKELTYIDKNKIRLYTMVDEDYPKRLKECQDAPFVFYYKGNANLDALKVISVVGTRSITDYGRKQTELLIKELSALFPDLLVVSGLAYGVDVCAHRSAMKNNLQTVGVLAHGLDRIYPAAHRNIAVEMLEQGGLLTDFVSHTNPDRENFLQRNRLIAGLSDATVVVESAEKGGALVTADIAFSYGRDVYAFPGSVGNKYSAGCNRLIQMNKAGLITSAKDLVMALCWDSENNTPSGTEQMEFTFSEKSNDPVIKLLYEKGEFHIDQLAAEMHLPIHKLTPMLFELEMEGYIKSLPGGIYKLV